MYEAKLLESYNASKTSIKNTTTKSLLPKHGSYLSKL